MLRTESKEVVGDIADEVINVVSGYEKQLRELAEANYPLTEIRVNLETKQVYIVWKDYSEEEKRIAELTQKALEIKKKLEETTDDVQKAVLMAELGKINEEYVKLTGTPIYEVI